MDRHGATLGVAVPLRALQLPEPPSPVSLLAALVGSNVLQTSALNLVLVWNGSPSLVS